MNKNVLLNLLDYVFVLRPTLLFPVWFMALAGYKYGQTGKPHHPIIYIIFLLSLLAGAIYLLNQFTDQESDRINKKLFLIAEGRISLVKALIEAVLLIVLSVGLAFLTAVWIGVLFAAILALGFLYNYRWKNHIWGGLLLNTISGGTILFAIGWWCAAGYSFKMILHSLPYWPAIASVYLATTLPDTAGDRQTGKRTFSVVFGHRQTMGLATILLIVTAMAGIFIQDMILFLSALCAFPFFIWAFIRQDATEMLRGSKIALLVFAVVLCRWFPFLLIFIVLNYYGARWYYRHRFNINYPYIFGRII